MLNRAPFSFLAPSLSLAHCPCAYGPVVNCTLCPTHIVSLFSLFLLYYYIIARDGDLRRPCKLLSNVSTLFGWSRHKGRGRGHARIPSPPCAIPTRSNSNPDTEVSVLKNYVLGPDFLTHTPPIDIREHGPSNAACRIDPRRAQQAENMPRGTSAPHTPSTPGAQCGRDRARPLRADPPDPCIE